MPVPTTAMAAMTGTPADGDAASDLAPGSDVAGQAPAIRVDVFGVFPEIVDQYCAQSLLGRARRVGTFELRCHDLRGYTTDVHRTTDDAPFGGGAGMLMKAEPILAAVEAVRPPRPLLLVGPGGRRLDQALAAELAVGGGFSLICGRYEGVDHRVREHVADGEISIGDYVLAGGELAACVIIEAAVRLIPGVLGNVASPVTESFGTEGLLEEPQYTRPAELRGWAVPPVLLSGNHGEIARWRRAQALHRTLAARPDLIDARGGISDVERALLEEFPAVPYP